MVAMFSMHRSRQTVCFTGGIPTELGQMTSLTNLSLYDNQLTGECDHKTCLIAIGKRVYHPLSHWFACFSGRIPTELGQLTALTNLSLDGNQLTGECD